MVLIKVSDFPNPIVAFGDQNSIEHSEILKTHMTLLKNLSVGISTAVDFIGPVSPAITIIAMLIGEVDKLRIELKKLEQHIFKNRIEGKLAALTRHLENLQDENTSESQKVAEIVCAVSALDELLPVFKDDDSIIRERYYCGAPLFVRLCGLVKALCLVTEQTSGYNTSNIQGLKRSYQEVLEWFKIKSIGGRLASCYVKMSSLPGDQWIYNSSDLNSTFSHYYDATQTGYSS